MSRERVAVRITACVRGMAEGVRVDDVRIGLGYTAVRLDNGAVGLAYTFRDLARGGCSVFKGRSPLAAQPASALLPLLESADAIEAAVGLACANALTNRDRDDLVEGDVLDHLRVGPDDDVGMVGHFGPLVGPIRERARSLTIFERQDHAGAGMRPEDEARDVLGRCQVALITATSVINGTLDGLLEAAAPCRDVVLLGASTPLLPEAFCGSATWLSGVIVRNADAVLRVVSEGGGMRDFGPYVRKVALATR